MLVLGIFRLIYYFFYYLTQDLSIMSLDESVYDAFALFFAMIEDGLGILNVYLDLPYLFRLLGIILVVDIFLRSFALIMWILRKIPLLGLS